MVASYPLISQAPTELRLSWAVTINYTVVEFQNLVVNINNALYLAIGLVFVLHHSEKSMVLLSYYRQSKTVLLIMTLGQSLLEKFKIRPIPPFASTVC